MPTEERGPQAPSSLDGFVRSSPLALAIVDPDGLRVRAASAPFARLLGSSPSQCGGLELAARLRNGKQVAAELAPLLERNEPVSGVRLHPRDGDETAFVVTAWRTEQGTGPVAVLAVPAGEDQELPARMRQVNEALLLRALEEKDRAARAEAASRSKSIFLASISHELRTPLNSILGYLDLMLQGIPDELAEGSQEHARRARSAATHLKDMIEQIITASRSGATDEDDTASVDIGEVAREVRDMVEGRAEEKGLALELRIDDGVEPLRARPRELRQILVNLATNAIKFTDQGTVRIEVERGEPLVMRVRDTGVGIEPEAQDRIFDQFWQVDAGMNRTSEGLGIGLWVVGTLVDRLGGEIRVDSEPGKGSVFELRIPRSEAGPAD